MSSPYLGEIRMVGFNFAPHGWAMCAGQTMPISQNTALFSLLGTQFGGNGTSTFALPNLNDSVPIGQGNGPGLTGRIVGDTGGEDSVALTSQTMPSHTHTAQATAAGATTYQASGNLPGIASRPIYGTSSPAPLAASALTPVGGSSPHNNLQPYLAVTFIIALTGVFPPRS